MLERGAAEGQFVLNYYTDESKRKLKGTICLDECEQVIKPIPTLEYKDTSLFIGITFQVDIGLTVENGRQRYEFMFDIKTPQRDYYLGTERER